MKDFENHYDYLADLSKSFKEVGVKRAPGDTFKQAYRGLVLKTS